MTLINAKNYRYLAFAILKRITWYLIIPHVTCDIISTARFYDNNSVMRVSAYIVYILIHYYVYFHNFAQRMLSIDS
jgi:hypothetical protein